jgi:hypothetical protein
MAKGWESKAVEDQVQENEKKAPKENLRRQLTPQQMEAHRRKAVLLLSRTRVEKDLNASQNARYKEQLTKALADLDAQIAALDE